MKLSWVELKLFLRDPFTLLFTFAYPLFVLFILANVFGNQVENEDDVRVWRGVGPTDYYVPAYVALVLASIGLLAMPLRLAGYRERGVLRRLRASGLQVWVILGSQLVVGALMAIVGAVSITLAARLVFGTFWPRDPIELLLAFVLGFAAFGTIGTLLGSVVPNSRAAQSLGLILFFVMFMISGSGPPRQAFGQTMRDIGEVLPLTHVILVLQDPWLGYGWATTPAFVVAGFLVGTAVLSLRLFKWD